jgi:predicted ATP-dependent serine protease
VAAVNTVKSDLREEFVKLLSAHVPGLHINGAKATGHVPWRDDEHPSFSADLSEGVWYDHARQEGGGVKEFKQRLGLNGAGHSQARTIVATYDYRDESGALLYQVVRYEPKAFSRRRPDGNGGWIWELGNVRRVLYNLPEVLKAETIYIVEGEKDADRLRSLGLTATCNPHGVGKWRAEYNETLHAKHAVILPDNDQPGERHTLHVARSLLPVAATVKVVGLPGLGPVKLKHGEDVSDWLDADHTKEELAALVEQAEAWQPEDVQTEQKPQSNGLALTKLGDLLNEPEEQVDWLVDKMLPAGGFALLVAKPKAGKSTLARNLALTASQGRDFFGKATQQGPVIYLALEEKRSEVKKHFKDMGATGEEEIYIFAASAPVDALQQIRAVTEEKKPVLIVIDPLFKLTRVKDGNDYAQVTAALEPLLVLARETGAHVLCVHHAGKGKREGGDSILGSTAIFAAVDTALLMKRTERYRTISSQQRYGEDLPETVLHFDSRTRTVSLGASKEHEEEKRLADAIVEFLRAKQAPAEEWEIQAEVEGRKAVQVRALRWLVEEEKVYRQRKDPNNANNRGNPFLYALDRHSFTSSHYINGNLGTSEEKEGVSPQEIEIVTGSRDPSAGIENLTGSRDPSAGQEPENSPSFQQQRAQDAAVEDVEVSASPSQGEALPWEEPEDAGVIE